MTKHKLEDHLTSNTSKLCIQTFLDSFSAISTEVQNPTLRRNKNFSAFLKRYEHPFQELKGLRTSSQDFEKCKIIGRGAYGEVQVVRHKQTRNIYAMKLLSKAEMLRRSDTAYFWEERDIMAFSDSDWIIKLFYAFQDDKFLYMVMEYMPGGDMVNLMSQYDMSEKWAMFYTAELVVALDVIHKMGFIHRDVKPDNMLLDSSGHIKLADFGTCMKMGPDGLVRTDTAVGTPDYISPEVLTSQQGNGVYGKECDWWSVGIILYEMMVNECPFFSESLVGTYSNIMDHSNTLKFPDEVSLSGNCVDLIEKLLTDRTTRLGVNGVAEIKNHAFFKNSEWGWDNIRDCPAPVQFSLEGDDDTSNFDDFDEEQVNTNFENASSFIGNHFPFVGFTFDYDYTPFKDKEDTTTADPDEIRQLTQRANENLARFNDAQRQLLKAKEELDDLKNAEKAAINEEAVAEYETQIQSLKQQIETERVAKTKLKTRNEELQRTIVAAKNDHDNVTEAMKDLKPKIDELENTKEKLKEVSKQKVAIQQQWNDLNQQFTKLKATSKTLDEQVKTKTAALKVMENTNKVDKKKLQEQFSNLQTEKDKNDILTDKLKTTKDKIVELEQKEEEYKKRIRDLENQNVNLQKTIAASSLNAAQQDHQTNDNLMKQLSDLQIDFNDKKKRLAEALAEKEILDKKLQETDERLLDSEQKLMELDQLAKRKEIEIVDLKQSNKSQSTVISQREEHITELETDVKNRKEEQIDLQHQLKKLSDSLEEQKTTNGKLEQQILDKTADHEKIKMERDDALLKAQTSLDKIDGYEATVSELKKQIQDRENEQKLIEDQNKELIRQKETEIGRLNDNIEVLKNDLYLKSQEVSKKEEVAEPEEESNVANLKSQIDDLQKKLSKEKMVKDATILKLEQIMQTKRPQDEGTSRENSKSRLDRLTRANRQLKQQNEKQEEQIRTIRNSHHKEVEMLQKKVDELVMVNEEIKKILSTKETENKQLINKIKMLSDPEYKMAESITRTIQEPNLENKLSTPIGKNLKKRNNWKTSFAVLTQTKFIMYDSESDKKEKKAANAIIDLQSIYTVRAMEQGELWRISAKDVPRLFQISYFSEDGNQTDLDMSTISVSGSSGVEFNGHHFLALPIADHNMNCDLCSKKLKGIFKTEAYECQRCQYKVHKEHVEREDKSVTACQSGLQMLLLLAEDNNIRQQWVERLNKYVVPKSNPNIVLAPMDSKVSPRTLPRSNTTTESSSYTRIFRRHSERPVGKGSRIKVTRNVSPPGLSPDDNDVNNSNNNNS